MRLSKLCFALLGVVALASGCDPSCDKTCRQVLKCDNLDSDRIAIDECKLECQSQERLWDDWVDEKELDQAFKEHKRCLVQSTCDEIEAGVCYDEQLFHLGTGTSTLGTGSTATTTSATTTSATTTTTTP